MNPEARTMNSTTSQSQLRIWGPLGHTLAHAIAAVLVMTMFLVGVPQFDRFYRDFDANLAPATQLTLEASRLIEKYWYAVFPLLILDGLTLFALSQLPGRAAGLATVYSLLLLLTTIAATALISLTLILPFVSLLQSLS
jgi:type II secretory pathway component PulF